MCALLLAAEATLCPPVVLLTHSPINFTMAVLAQKSCTAKLAQKASRASAVRAPVVVVRAQKQNVESVEVVRNWSSCSRSMIAAVPSSAEQPEMTDKPTQIDADLRTDLA